MAQEYKNIITGEKRTVINHKTGEIDEEIITQTFKVPKTEDFIMLFTKNLSKHTEKLTGREQELLNKLLEKYVTTGNIVMLDTPVRKKLANEIGITINHIKNLVKELKKKKYILVDNDGLYYLNPYLFGKGKWTEILKLRQQFTYEYDFEKNELKETIISVGVYEGVDNVKNMDIEKIEHKKEENKEVIDVFLTDKKISKQQAIEKLKKLAKKHLIRDEALHLQKSSDLRKFRTEAIEVKNEDSN